MSESANLASRQLELEHLNQKILLHTPTDGKTAQNITGLHTARYSKPDETDNKAFYLPSVMLVTQGSKQLLLGQENYVIKPGELLVLPVALPVTMRVATANYQVPYLGVGLDLELKKITELVTRLYPNGLPKVLERKAGYTAAADLQIIAALNRLMDCLADPVETKLLAPIIQDEILLRLLRSSLGVQLAELALADSAVQNITVAIDWLRRYFDQPIKVAELAAKAHLSTSAFYTQFKAVTGVTPLHYQKALRLQEARRLMLTENRDAQSAGNLVGYLSPAQFNREYRLYFGIPPKKDILQLRNKQLEF